MDHIGNTLKQSSCLQNLLKRYQKQVKNKQKVLSLLSPQQQADVVSITRKKGYILICLRHSYGVAGIRQALRNLNEPYRLQIVIGEIP